VLHIRAAVAEVDASGSHAFICKKAPGHIARHQALNDVAARAFVSAGSVRQDSK